ncbi:MAG TPA: IS110 family transposase [Nitrospiria bacterium]|jgi:transposase
MSKRDFSKQVERRQKIKRTTLVVGVDIGSTFNAVALMNKEGEVLGKYPKIYNSRRGFDYFAKVIEEVKTSNGFKGVLMGIEPTGHYWRKIAYFAKERGYEVRFIRTTGLKHQRGLDESSSAKTDMRDPTLANITREGKYIDTVIEDGVFRQLRTLAKLRERVLRYSVSSQNTLGAVLDDYFPELKRIFSSMKIRSLWAKLQCCPFPQDVVTLEVSMIAEVIGKSSRRRAEAAQKAMDLYQAAKESIGLKQVINTDRYRLKLCLQEVQRSEGLLKEIGMQMKKLLEQIPCCEYILSVPGVGALSAAVFLGELGNPNHFNHPKQIIKYSGYDPQERDSGKRVGRKIISKKGRWLLRKTLFFMSMRVVQQCQFFKDYYRRKLENQNRFGQLLKKKEGLCAVAIKLIKVIFALLRDKRGYGENVSSLTLAA